MDGVGGPGHAIGSVAGFDQGGLPVGRWPIEVEYGYLMADVAGDVGYLAVGPDEDGLRLGWNVDGADYGEVGEVDDG